MNRKISIRTSSALSNSNPDRTADANSSPSASRLKQPLFPTYTLPSPYTVLPRGGRLFDPTLLDRLRTPLTRYRD